LTNAVPQDNNKRMRATRTPVTVQNSFHLTEATFYVDEAGLFSKDVYRRVRRKLCGVPGCECQMPYAIAQAEDLGGFRRLPEDMRQKLGLIRFPNIKYAEDNA